MTRQRYNLANIRDLLVNGFTDEDLRRLCFDVPDFQPVYHELARGTGKAAIVDRLLEHAETRMQIPTLLALAKKQSPERYEYHGPYHADGASHAGPDNGFHLAQIEVTSPLGGSTTRVQITLDMSMKDFDSTIKRLLKYGLAGFLGISPDAVRVVAVQPGSLKVVVELPTERAEALLAKYEDEAERLAECLAPLLLLDVRMEDSRQGTELDPQEAVACRNDDLAHNEQGAVAVVIEGEDLRAKARQSHDDVIDDVTINIPPGLGPVSITMGFAKDGPDLRFRFDNQEHQTIAIRGYKQPALRYGAEYYIVEVPSELNDLFEGSRYALVVREERTDSGADVPEQLLWGRFTRDPSKGLTFTVEVEDKLLAKPKIVGEAPLGETEALIVVGAFEEAA